MNAQEDGRAPRQRQPALTGPENSHEPRSGFAYRTPDTPRASVSRSPKLIESLSDLIVWCIVAAAAAVLILIACAALTVGAP